MRYREWRERTHSACVPSRFRRWMRLARRCGGVRLMRPGSSKTPKEPYHAQASNTGSAKVQQKRRGTHRKVLRRVGPSRQVAATAFAIFRSPPQRPCSSQRLVLQSPSIQNERRVVCIRRSIEEEPPVATRSAHSGAESEPTIRTHQIGDSALRHSGNRSRIDQRKKNSNPR